MILKRIKKRIDLLEQTVSDQETQIHRLNLENLEMVKKVYELTHDPKFKKGDNVKLKKDVFPNSDDTVYCVISTLVKTKANFDEAAYFVYNVQCGNTLYTYKEDALELAQAIK